eukprot:TRINITY_DN5001_c0_g1_i1.p1 TRINITY_DN5001_c0_g1~~TRINITY_DN5001_c0_g1_i1.p1  ORF type:complete len:203 (+),score=33.78 TRINITY_DN5001_c0_g1_i1:19-627(+)
MACNHQHDCGEHDCAADWSLFRSVDLPNVWALNEAVEGSAKSVFKSWEKRLDFGTGFLETNSDDPELLLFIPFNTDVKIRSISVVGGGGGTSPSNMRAFLNRIDIDFSNVWDLTPVQEWEIAENLGGELEYPTKYPRFQGVANLTLHFPRSFGASSTRIHFVGLKGESTQIKRDAVTTIVYETMGTPTEHKLPSDEANPQIL